MVEDGDAGLEELSASVFPHTGRASTIGLTGSPGVGKSTLAGELVRVARE
ncbi:MAG: methylmalonyl Co-A mutase-associated GTPase MeaB, partial [Actinomycetota bacterium]